MVGQRSATTALFERRSQLNIRSLIQNDHKLVTSGSQAIVWLRLTFASRWCHRHRSQHYLVICGWLAQRRRAFSELAEDSDVVRIYHHTLTALWYNAICKYPLSHFPEQIDIIRQKSALSLFRSHNVSVLWNSFTYCDKNVSRWSTHF